MVYTCAVMIPELKAALKRYHEATVWIEILAAWIEICNALALLTPPVPCPFEGLDGRPDESDLTSMNIWVAGVDLLYGSEEAEPPGG